RLQPRPHPGLGGRAGRAGAGQPGAGDGGRARRPARRPRPARPRLHHPRAVVAVRQHLQLRHRRRVLRDGVRLPQAPFPGPLRQLRRLRAPDGGARARVLARFPALNGRRGARIGYASPMQQRVDSMDVAESALQRLAWGVHNVLGFAFTLAWTAGWISLALLVLGLTRRRALALRMAARCWAPGLLTGAGARLVVEGAERVDWSRPHLLVANHQSVIDICALFRAVPVPLHFLLKQEMTRVPFVGWYARACGMLFIERDNARAGARMRREAAALLRAGHTLCLFPEGTRSRTGVVAPFKGGAFQGAIDAGVEVLPVAISGAGAVLPPGGFRVRAGTIRVRFGTPLPTAGAAQGAAARQALADAAHAAVVRLLDGRP